MRESFNFTDEDKGYLAGEGLSPRQVREVQTHVREALHMIDQMDSVLKHEPLGKSHGMGRPRDYRKNVYYDLFGYLFDLGCSQAAATNVVMWALEWQATDTSGLLQQARDTLKRQRRDYEKARPYLEWAFELDENGKRVASDALKDAIRALAASRDQESEQHSE